jgi:ribosomal protein L40E
MFCKKCGANIADNAKFCKKCGAKIEKDEQDNTSVTASNESSEEAVPEVKKVIICRNCGSENPVNREFCNKCGADINKLNTAPKSNSNTFKLSSLPDNPPPVKKKSPLPLILVLFAVIGAGIFIITRFNNQTETPAINANTNTGIIENNSEEISEAEITTTAEPEIEYLMVTAAELNTAYEDNRLYADKTYTDQLVEITGQVAEVEKGILYDGYYVVLGDTAETIAQAREDRSLGELILLGDYRVHCVGIPESEMMNLSKGELITVRGKVSGYAGFYVDLINCEISVKTELNNYTEPPIAAVEPVTEAQVVVIDEITNQFLLPPTENNSAFSPVSDFEYYINSDDKITITVYTGTDRDIVIPAVIDGRSVEQIEGGEYGETGLEENETVNINSVTIPDSVILIGDNAFSDCESLTNIYVDNNNPMYSSQDGILFNKDKTELIFYPNAKSAESYNIPDGVKTIHYHAFSHNAYLMFVNIPNSVTHIEEFSFMYCTNFNSVTIPEGVISIGSGAFKDCPNLTTVIIAQSVEIIGNGAFSNCRNLQSAWFEGNAPELSDDFNYGNTVFYDTASEFTLYYKSNTTGWENSTWIDYPNAEW